MPSAPSMRIVVLSSGGKDSTLSLWWSMCQGWEVCAIVTVVVEGDDSWMFQIPATNITSLQAKSTGIDYHTISVSGESEVEVEQLLEGLRPLINSNSVDGLVSGALRSEYQRRRLDGICEELGIHSFSPLWHHDPEQHMRELIECGMEMKMVSVSSDGLGRQWLGRTIDDSNFEELLKLSKQYRFNIDGEGGEFETVILSGPHMDGNIVLECTESWSHDRGHLNIKSMHLSDR
ncbi:MAG: diphthine--ammonia ligase [Candidatus Poseidoniaceae archaeon]|nr:diphthine--ammonia ligase [Candidatus Poseidoniaceae archaeon]